MAKMKSKVRCEICKEICGTDKASVADVRRLEVLYKKLHKCGPESPLLKYLTRIIFEAIKTKRTRYKMSLLDCLRGGIENYEGPYDTLGIYAADPECYDVFAVLFDTVLKDKFNFKDDDVHPPLDFGETPSNLGTIDTSGGSILSTRIRCCRALKGYPFNTGLTEEQYIQIEQTIEAALLQLEGPLAGTYVKLADISDAEQKRLRKERILFKEGDEIQKTAKICEFYPTGRGYFTNKKKQFIVWVNEKDHLRIISMQKGSNLGNIYQILVDGLNVLDEKLRFAKHDKYGYLSSNPFNLGTAIKASVHINLPKLGKDLENLVKVVEKNNLQVKGIDCELSATKTGTFDLSSSKSIGITEYEMLKEFFDGVQAVIKIEKALQ